MDDQFYDANYEAMKRYERERTEQAIDKLAEKYSRELSAEYCLGGGRTSEGRAALRSYGRSKALAKLEELGRGY